VNGGFPEYPRDRAGYRPRPPRPSSRWAWWSDSDDYSDDLPFWTRVGRTPHLVLPYSLDVNDMRFVGSPGFAHGGQFFDYARDTFDQLYEEGAELPRMMSIGLHGRLSGRPGRARAVARLLDHIGSHEGVWFARRIDIAQH
jgi:peptidoglycan/xylan/chitin deacetylase (PgdA/CDA1 family)